MLFESVKMKNTAERNEWGFTKESNDRKSRQLLKKTHTDLRTRKICMGKVYGLLSNNVNKRCLALIHAALLTMIVLQIECQFFTSNNSIT